MRYIVQLLGILGTLATILLAAFLAYTMNRRVVNTVDATVASYILAFSLLFTVFCGVSSAVLDELRTIRIAITGSKPSKPV